MAWLNAKRIDDHVDAYDKLLQRWFIALIIDKTVSQFKIHWYGWKPTFDEWINTTDKRLAPLNTHTIPMIILKPLPHIIPPIQPLYAKYNNSKYIIIPDFGCGRTYTIHKYNIDTNEWTEDSNSGDDVQFSSTTPCFAMDAKYCKLYSVISCDNILNIDLEQGIWKTHPQKSLNWKLFDETAFDGYVQITDQRLHIFSFSGEFLGHLVYDVSEHEAPLMIAEEQTLTIGEELEQTFVQALRGYIAQVRLEGIDKFLIFSRNNSHNMVFEGSTVDCANGSIQWKQNKCLINENICFYYLRKVYVIFEHLVLIQVIETEPKKCVSMWILDVKTEQWFRCNDDALITGFIVNTMDNYAHVMMTSLDWYSHQENYHCKINLLDIIPEKLDNLYRREIYSKLVYGFVRKSQNNQQLSYNIPVYLKELILKYYPCFLYS